MTTTALDHIVDIPSATKALVVAARSQGVAEWVKKVQSDWTSYIYIVTTDTNPNATLRVPANNGNEAMRCLSFIIDNYDSLPDFIAFRHGHEKSWHQEADAADEVNYLNLTTVRSRGYQNFYCVKDMCEQHVYLAAMQREKEASDGGTNKRLSARAGPEVNDAIYDHWLSWFDGAPMPEHITAACCAQFVVTKEAVYTRPKEKYIQWRQWLLATPLDSYLSGATLEYLWHIIFGMPPVVCESGDDCKCNVYTGPLQGNCGS